MKLLNIIYANILGWLKGSTEKRKYLYRIESKKEQKRLQIFWQKSGAVELDEIELNAFHAN